MAKRIFDKKRGVLTTSGSVTSFVDLIIPNNTCVGFILKVVSKDTTANVGAMIHQVGSISNNTGITTLDGVVSSLASIINPSLAGITTILTANSSNLRLSVTGIILKDLDWQYEIEMIHN